MWGAQKTSERYKARVNWTELEKGMLKSANLPSTRSLEYRSQKGHDQQVLAASIYDKLCKERDGDLAEESITPKIGTNYHQFPLEIDDSLVAFYYLTYDSGGLCHIHDSYLCNVYHDSVPWPTQRIMNVSDNFVGSNGHGPMAIECPKECRPMEHKDWLYC
jgi:hypothetical protein